VILGSFQVVNGKCPINVCPNINHYEDMGILRIKVANGIIV
jgi:hypothetical protein